MQTWTAYFTSKCLDSLQITFFWAQIQAQRNRIEQKQPQKRVLVFAQRAQAKLLITFVQEKKTHICHKNIVLEAFWAVNTHVNKFQPCHFHITKPLSFIQNNNQMYCMYTKGETVTGCCIMLFFTRWGIYFCVRAALLQTKCVWQWWEEGGVCGGGAGVAGVWPPVWGCKQRAGGLGMEQRICIDCFCASELFSHCRRCLDQLRGKLRHLHREAFSSCFNPFIYFFIPPPPMLFIFFSQ